MGKPTGFLEFERVCGPARPPKERVRDYREFHLPLSEKERKFQGARCMDCGVPFCQSGMVMKGMASGCPLSNLIPEWNDLICSGSWAQAYSRLKKTNNFPEFTSRVCPAPCEAACTCGLGGDPVTVRENEYAVIERAYRDNTAAARPPRVRTGRKVAVVGSGPAGLAAADQLNRRGHSVTVFERDDRVGGLLMYGIPNMKLEKHIIDRKINVMREEGIVFETGVNVGKDCRASRLLKEFDCVVLACGASNPRDIQVPGREAEGICFAVDFLKGTTKSLLDSGLTDGKFVSAKGKKVLVVGGGDTGNDCVGTCIRHGCASVMQLEMMPRLPDRRDAGNTWPEWPRVFRVDYGQEEAAAVFGKDPRVYETTVKEFKKDKNGRVKKAVLMGVKAERDERTGQTRMVPVEGSVREVDTDLVLIAAGFLGSQKYVTDAFGVKVDDRTNVSTEAGGYKTSADRVFTAGDMHRGQSLVVWAIREGREAAREVDRSLMGYTNLM